jgi:hypothetical protein
VRKCAQPARGARGTSVALVDDVMIDARRLSVIALLVLLAVAFLPG